jgi:hypothetical protein
MQGEVPSSTLAVKEDGDTQQTAGLVMKKTAWMMFSCDIGEAKAVSRGRL